MTSSEEKRLFKWIKAHAKEVKKHNDRSYKLMMNQIFKNYKLCLQNQKQKEGSGKTEPE